jgi:hypothetical protein
VGRGRTITDRIGSHQQMDSANASFSGSAREAAQPAVEGLSDRDGAILGFERHWWKYAGAKEQAIRDQFQMSATRYYQVLNALIDRPEALAHDPLLVKRLRRLRAARQRARSARRLGIEV